MRSRKQTYRATGVAFAALLTLTAAACAGGGSGGSTAASTTTSSSPLPSVTGPVTITFDEAMSSGAQLKTITALVKTFEAANPDITVTLQASADYGTLYTKEKAQIAAGTPPTIAQVYEDWAASYADSQVIVPISTLAGTASPTQLSTFYTGIQKDLRLPDGKLWMWPFNKSIQVAVFNQNMLTAKGLTAPTTWAAFATDLKAEAGHGVTGISINPGSSSGATGYETWLEVMAADNGTPAFSPAGVPQFTSTALVSALQYLVGLKTAGALTVDTSSDYPGETALGAEKGGADITTAAGVYYEQQDAGTKFTVDVTGLPGTDNQLSGTNIVAFAAATAQQKAAAWTFMQYLASAQAQATWASATGYLPVTSAALADMTGYLAQNSWVTAAIPQLNTAITDPPFAWVDQCEGDISVAMQAALDNGTAPASALATAQSSCLSQQANS
jgi:multiple sugar transport system substrate-binding protein